MLQINAQITRIYTPVPGNSNESAWARQDFVVRFLEDGEITNPDEFQFSICNQNLSEKDMRIGDIVNIIAIRPKSTDLGERKILITKIELVKKYEDIEYKECESEKECLVANRLAQFDPIFEDEYHQKIGFYGEEFIIIDLDLIWNEGIRLMQLTNLKIEKRLEKALKDLESD